MTFPPKGRLVLNHSTHIKGLIKTLETLCGHPQIKSITPGRIARTGSRPTPLKIKVTIPITGGFKLVARSHRGVQEVFVITELSKEDLQKTLNNLTK